MPVREFELVSSLVMIRLFIGFSLGPPQLKVSSQWLKSRRPKSYHFNFKYISNHLYMQSLTLLPHMSSDFNFVHDI